MWIIQFTYASDNDLSYEAIDQRSKLDLSFEQ
jgi:hypothetical protein